MSDSAWTAVEAIVPQESGLQRAGSSMEPVKDEKQREVQPASQSNPAIVSSGVNLIL